MSEAVMNLKWEEESLKRFNDVIERIPIFHRNIAKEVVIIKAEINAKERKADMVKEADIVQAFFTEVPMAFYSLMIKLLGDVGFDYKKFEPEETKKDESS